MAVEITELINVVPVFNMVPPLETSYQFMIPAYAVAFNVTVPASHLVAPMTPVMVGIALTVATVVPAVKLAQPFTVAVTL